MSGRKGSTPAGVRKSSESNTPLATRKGTIPAPGTPSMGARKDAGDTATSPRSSIRSKEDGGGAGAVARHFSMLRGKPKTKGADSLQDDYVRAMELIDEGDVKRFHGWLEEKIEEDGKELLFQVDEHGWTLFHYACNSGRLEEAYSLLDAGCDMAAVTHDDTTGLHYLAKLSEVDRQPISVYNQLLHVMATKGANLNQRKRSGETPLHVAAMRGNQVAVSFLLEAGCDVNAVTLDGAFTAIHYAVMSNQASIISELLRCGAKATLACKQGNAHEIAVKLQLVPIVTLLDEWSARAAQPEAPMAAGTDKDVCVVTTNSGTVSVGVITGCWDDYRDNIFPRTHFVYRLDLLFYLCILPNRTSADGERYEGLLIDNLGFSKVTVPSSALDLYKAQDLALAEQLRRFLNSRGDMSQRSKSSGQHLSLLSSAAGAAVEWSLMKHPELSARLLELETKLTPRKRICVGLIYGKADQTREEDMFRNAASSGFEKFMAVLGEKVEVGKWPGWLGTFNAENDKGQFALYTSWMGFEFVFHVAPYLDPGRQRQHIGNDLVLIFWKEGAMQEPEFRGQVNSVALVVTPHKVRKPSGAPAALVVEDTASPSLGRASRRKKVASQKQVSMACFHRTRLDSFTPVLPEGTLEVTGNRALIRSYVLSNVVNGTMAGVKSGPFAVNNSKLFSSTISKLIEDERTTK